MTTADTFKVSVAGVIGFVSQLTNVDLAFRVVIGGLTIGYLSLKFFRGCFDMCDWWRKRARRKARIAAICSKQAR